METLTFVLMIKSNGKVVKTTTTRKKKLIAKSHESQEDGFGSCGNGKSSLLLLLFLAHTSYIYLHPMEWCLQLAGRYSGQEDGCALGKWAPFIEMQRPEEFHFISHFVFAEKQENGANSL